MSSTDDRWEHPFPRTGPAFAKATARSRRSSRELRPSGGGRVLHALHQHTACGRAGRFSYRKDVPEGANGSGCLGW